MPPLSPFPSKASLVNCWFAKGASSSLPTLPRFSYLVNCCFAKGTAPPPLLFPMQRQGCERLSAPFVGPSCRQNNSNRVGKAAPLCDPACDCQSHQGYCVLGRHFDLNMCRGLLNVSAWVSRAVHYGFV